jgi:hypothetical protein
MAQTTYTTVPVGAGGAGTSYTVTNTGAGGYGPITVNTTGAANIVGGGITTSTLNGTSGAYLTSNGTWGTSPTFTTVNTTAPSIQVKGDAEFDGDVKLQGKSLNAWMETMEKRLAILVPNPKKLKQYEALQKAYKHYKMLEALCEEQDDESNQ